MTGLRGHDLQRFAVNANSVKSQIEGALTFGQALTGSGLECFDLAVVVRGAQVLDLARTAPCGPHDLHRGRSRRGLHGAHVSHHSTLRAEI